jgi:hypothetical protein
MKALRMLAALAVAVAGLSLAGCQNEAEQDRPNLGVEPVEPGTDERTGFGEEPREGEVIEEEEGVFEGNGQEPVEELEQDVEREVE